jgi:hypothetical protein
MANNGMKRRDFFGKAAAGLVTTGLSLPLLNAGTTEQKELNKFVYRTLGRTKLRIPIVSFGVMNSDSPDLLNRALDAGVNHLDTAHGYLRGNSERVIGEVLERRGGRDKVYVATKMYFARDREKGPANKVLVRLKKNFSSSSRLASRGCERIMWIFSTSTASTLPRWSPTNR